MKNKSLTQEKQNKIDKRITELITEEKYGQFTPLIQEYLNRALNEYDLSPEFIDIFSEGCQTVKVGKMPKEIGWALGLRSEKKKNITISDNVIKVAKKEKKDNIYEYVSHILNHEMMHVLIQDIPGVGNALTEAIVEVAASRTSFGKDKKRMKSYREETLGYGNITFGANILSAAMGISEKEFIQLAFEHKISEELEKQIGSKDTADRYLYEINKELEKIRRATFEEKHIKKIDAIQTEAYHAIYIKRKRIIKLKTGKYRNKQR